MAASSEHPLRRPVLAAILAIAAIALFWAFPAFRIVPLGRTATAVTHPSADPAFDPAVVAAKLWSGELREAAQRAPEADIVIDAIRANPTQARQQHARSVGMGAAYYFVRGSGRVIARDRNVIRLALEGPRPALVSLRIGPIFGNAVRDGCGLLDVNQTPGLHEFNTLASELNQLVESQVLPVLRDKANVGATVTFAGCAEAPEAAAAADEPLLALVPVAAEVRE